MKKIHILLTLPVSAGFLTYSCNNQDTEKTITQDSTKNHDHKIQNVVIIVGDDHAPDVVGCYGNQVIQTPNLDRLASQGIMFQNAYSNAPVSSASRQSILTGKYPHATGVSLLTTPFCDSTNTTIAEYLKNYGYATAIIGKTHFNNFTANPPTHGFDLMVDSKAYHEYLAEHPPTPIPDSIKTQPKWRPFRDPARIWLNADMLPSPCYDKDCHDTYLANRAAQYINQQKDNPFFLWVGFHNPHSPFRFPIEYAGKYHPDSVPLPEGSDEDERWIPEIFKNLTEKDKRGIIASYYNSVDYLDKNVGIIVEELKKQGLYDNTLIIYIGDQGYLLNDHKRFEKHTMWEEAIKAPFIMRAGNVLPQDEKLTQPVEFVDIIPTITDLLGLEKKMQQVQGKSMLPYIKGEKQTHKEYVFAEFLEDNKAMIANDTWKYIFTTGQRDLGQGYATGLGPSGVLHKLYNLKNDPKETTNVANKPENEAIVKKLQNAMINIFTQTHPEADSLPKNLTNEEILIWFCEPRDIGSEPGHK